MNLWRLLDEFLLLLQPEWWECPTTWVMTPFPSLLCDGVECCPCVEAMPAEMAHDCGDGNDDLLCYLCWSAMMLEVELLLCD